MPMVSLPVSPRLESWVSLHRAIQMIEQLVRPRQESQARFGQRDFSGGPVEQPGLHDEFQARYRLAYLLLAQVELRGCPVEAQILGHRNEISQMSKFDQGGTSHANIDSRNSR
jgi:hypothetical protein